MQKILASIPKSVCFFVFISTFAICADKPRIAVAPFGVSDPELHPLAEAVTANIASALTKLKIVSVVDRSALALMFQEAGLSLSGIVDGEKVLEAGKLKGADYLIAGKLHDATHRVERDPQEATGVRSGFADLCVSWRMYRVTDGAVVYHNVDVFNGGSRSAVGTNLPDHELIGYARNYAYENVGSAVARAVSEAFPIQTHIAAVKKFDEDGRYAETVYLPLTESDGIQDGQRLQIGIRMSPSSDDVWFFGELKIDGFENTLAVADIKRGEKNVLIDSINSIEGTSPYVVRSGPSALRRADVATIAVLPLSGGIRQAYKDVLFELLCSHIFQSRRFGVADRGRISELIRERNMQVSGIVGESALQQLGAAAGVDAILAGSIERCSVTWKNNESRPWRKECNVSFGVSARLVDVKTGSIIWAGTMDNKAPLGTALLLGLLGGRTTDVYSNEFAAIKQESQKPFSQIVGSLISKYPMESSNVRITLDGNKIQYVLIPFGYADGLLPDLKNTFFLMFEREKLLGKIREIPIAELELAAIVDYHVSATKIDKKLIDGEIDPNKTYAVKLMKRE